jgi:hypothetical protein
MIPSAASTPLLAAISKKNRHRALFVLALVPALFLFGWINQYAVNIPFGDEWAMIPLLTKSYGHQLAFWDLYAQHNEHRIVIPKLVFIAFAHLTGWNLLDEMFFSVALCVGTSAGIYVLLRRTLAAADSERVLLWGAANLLIFSPAQVENWLWGFSLQVFIPNFCLVMALVVLTSAYHWWLKFGAAVVLIAIATFSFGGGILLWPLIAIFLLLRGEKKSHVAAWLLVFGIVAGVLFIGYQRRPSPQPTTGNWLDYPGYFFAFVGGALVREREGPFLLTAIVTGALAVAIYGAIAAQLLKRRGEALANAAPWLALGLYVIASAAVAAYSRVDWGPLQAIDSRYVTVSHNLYVALIALAVIATRGTDESGPSIFGASRVVARTALITTIVVLTLAGFPKGLRSMAFMQRDRLVGVGTLEFSDAIETNDAARSHLMMLPTVAPVPAQSIAELQRLHLLHYPIRANPVLEDAEGRPMRSTSEFGQTEGVAQRDSSNFEISGWSFLPEYGFPAPLVVLAYRKGDHWIAFALSEVGEIRRDVAARFHSRDYLESGWRKTFDRATVPVDAERISAWSLDPSSSEVYKLPGDYLLPKL